MKTRKNFCLWLAALTLVATATATSTFAGVRKIRSTDGAGSSGGGDNLTDDTGAAWFLGSQRTIRACFELAPDFGVDAATARGEIEGAFTEWQHYIDRKFASEKLPLDITTSVSVSPFCTGNEDLVFFFGTMNEEIRLAKAKYVNPTAFTFKRFYDRGKQWGQGWIWFAPPGSVFPSENFPNWKPLNSPYFPSLPPSPFVLKTMLMHEIGHVLGNSHVSGTIMAEGISDDLRALQNTYPSIGSDTTRIDQSRELAVCWECAYSWSGTLSISNSASHHDTIAPNADLVAKENFELLTGQKARGKWLLADIWAKGFLEGTELVLTDEGQIHKFPLHFDNSEASTSNFTLVEDSEPIFKRDLPHPTDSGPLLKSAKVQGIVAYGSITTHSGETLMLIMERNLPVPTSKPLDYSTADYRLKYIRNGQVHPLFEASWFHIVVLEPGPVVGTLPKPTNSPTPVQSITPLPNPTSAPAQPLKPIPLF